MNNKEKPMSWISERIVQLQSAFASFIPNMSGCDTSCEQEPENLSSLKVADLKALAKERGFKGYTGLRKAQLAEMLKQN